MNTYGLWHDKPTRDVLEEIQHHAEYIDHKTRVLLWDNAQCHAVAAAVTVLAHLSANIDASHRLCRYARLVAWAGDYEPLRELVRQHIIEDSRSAGLRRNRTPVGYLLKTLLRPTRPEIPDAIFAAKLSNLETLATIYNVADALTPFRVGGVVDTELLADSYNLNRQGTPPVIDLNLQPGDLPVIPVSITKQLLLSKNKQLREKGLYIMSNQPSSITK